jgi:hypothetical protein
MKEHMFYNVFLVFKGITKEMTAEEAIRLANEQMTILGPAVGRDLNVLKNILRIVVQKAHDRGRLPEIPDIMYDENGDVPYEIDFTSILASAQRSTDMRAMQNAIAMASPFIQLDPSSVSKIDAYRGIDSAWDVAGADKTVIRDTDEAMKIVAEQTKQQQMAQEVAMLQGGAKAMKDMSAADKNYAG